MSESNPPRVEPGEKPLSYANFRRAAQQYLQLLLSSSQDTGSVLAEMVGTVRRLVSTHELGEAPIDIQRFLQLQPDALYRYGGVVWVEGVPAPPPLDGGVIKLDDPQIYGLSMISVWLDCIVSGPEQGLDSLRRVFLRAADTMGIELNRTFSIDLGRIQPIDNPQAWETDLLRQEEPDSLSLDRVTNIVQALGLEAPKPMSRVPIAIWRHLLTTRPIYDLSARFTRAGRDTARARLIALHRDTDEPSQACLYRVGLAPMPEVPPPAAPITLEDLQATLGCAGTTPVQLELIERADHLRGSAPATFSTILPLEALPRIFSRMLNRPSGTVIHDVTTSRARSPRLLRVSVEEDPDHAVRLFRVQLLPRKEWPGREGWKQVYRFRDLGDIGVTTCPPEAYLQVSLPEDGRGGTENAELYFHRWGQKRVSFRISGLGLHRTAQSGSLILLNSDQETALEVLAALQGLMGPAAQEIATRVSVLDCQVQWRPSPGSFAGQG